jgi:hypothetical protein
MINSIRGAKHINRRSDAQSQHPMKKPNAWHWCTPQTVPIPSATNALSFTTRFNPQDLIPPLAEIAISPIPQHPQALDQPVCLHYRSCVSQGN